MNYDTVASHLRVISFLTKGVKITLTDERHKKRNGRFKKDVFEFLGGIVDFVQYLNNKRRPCFTRHPYILTENAAMCVWKSRCSTTIPTMRTYCLLSITYKRRQRHISGFKTAHTKVMNEYARSAGLLKDKGQSLQAMITAKGCAPMINIRMKDAQFEGQTKARLETLKSKP